MTLFGHQNQQQQDYLDMCVVLMQNSVVLHNTVHFRGDGSYMYLLFELS